MVPLLLRGYALPQLTANATALLPNVATCAAGGTVFTLASPEHVDIPAAVFAAVAASLVAPRAARVAHLLPARTQKLLFAGCMLLSAPCVVYKAEISNWLLKNNSSRPDKEPPAPLQSSQSFLKLPSCANAAYYLLLGGAVGGASGVLGIGAGTMMTLGLALGGLPSHKAVLGTSFVAQIGPGFTGAFAHYRLGNVRTDLLWRLCVGSALGSAVSSQFAVGNVNEDALRKAFGVFCLVLGGNALRTAMRMK